MVRPLVSVCIPVYNGAEFVKFALDSVLQQDFESFEVVVVDNCSTDGTPQIVKSYGDRRIRLLMNSRNIGLVANWNRAVKEARGKYIKLLPADDLIYQDCLKRQFSILDGDTNEEIAVVCGRKRIINEQGRVLFDRGFARKETRLSGAYAVKRTLRSGGNLIGEGGSVLFRRTILEKTGYFTPDILYLLDLDLWFRMLVHGALHCLPDTVSAFRLSRAAASTQLKNQQFRDTLRFIMQTYKSRKFGVSLLDTLIGATNAALLTTSRKLLYKFAVR